jgi:hypothetical protein
MMELAHFYNGWTLDYIRSLSIRELNVAREYMNHVNSQGGESGKQRHSSIKGSGNR